MKFDCECDKRSINDQQYWKLKKILPLQYVYRICSYDPNVQEEDGFYTTIRLKLRTVEEAQDWQRKFQVLSKTTMRVDKTYPESGLKNIYKIDLRCHHKTRTPAKVKVSSKNTGCRATMTVIVKRSDAKKQRSKDSHIKEFPTMIVMKYVHNHPIDSAAALRHRDVTEEVREKFLKMFRAGLSPSAALKKHKSDLFMENPEDFENLSGDRGKIPDLQWCYRLYYKTLKTVYGGCKENMLQGTDVTANNEVADENETAVANLNSESDIPITNREMTTYSYNPMNDPVLPSNVPCDYISVSSGQSGVKIEYKVVEVYTEPEQISHEVDHSYQLVQDQLDETDEVLATSNELSDYFQLLQYKLAEDPTTFLPAIQSFLKSGKKLSSDSALALALRTFGKYTELSQALGIKRNRIAGLKNHRSNKKKKSC